jgi:hypothetical protein
MAVYTATEVAHVIAAAAAKELHKTHSVLKKMESF